MGERGAPASCGCGAVGVEDRRARLAAWCAFMVRLCSCTRLIITISRASEPCMQHTTADGVSTTDLRDREDLRPRCTFMVRSCACSRLIITISCACDPCMWRTNAENGCLSQTSETLRTQHHTSTPDDRLMQHQLTHAAMYLSCWLSTHACMPGAWSRRYAKDVPSVVSRTWGS